MSSSESLHRSPEPEEKQKPNKIFVTNLEVDVPPELRRLLLTSCSLNYGISSRNMENWTQ